MNRLAKHTTRRHGFVAVSLRIAVLAVVVTILLFIDVTAASAQNTGSANPVGIDGIPFPDPPKTKEGPLDRSTRSTIDRIIKGLEGDAFDRDGIVTLGESGDPRVLWFINDLLRFARREDLGLIQRAFAELTGVTLPGRDATEVANHLIAWDLPAPPDYRKIKRSVFTIIEPKWAPFFDDQAATIDWRLVAWGGVWIDDRHDASPGMLCNRCIPALDDPPVTRATDGDWYPDDALVFGLVINGEARAYPKNMMEVHEMVNDTLGGRRVGIPYCTLCGSAQAYYIDNVNGFRPVLRTSGLLARSNKFMYDLSTMSAIDTFTGVALSGPLRRAGVILDQASVVTSTWTDWKLAHPDTTILAGDGGIPGNRYPLNPLRGRDDDGPIFPIGDVDTRLPVQELVLGVHAADGTPLAFPVGTAVLALRAGEAVTLRGVRLDLEGSGVRAFIGDADASSHESFWFAWSQFKPRSLVWAR